MPKNDDYGKTNHLEIIGGGDNDDNDAMYTTANCE